MRLSERRLIILETLYNSSLPVATEDLMKITNVSMRTIRYDISEIKKYLLERHKIELLSKRNKGYYIKPKDKVDLIYLFEKEKKLSVRMLKVFYLLAFSYEKYTINTLANKMYFSESTVRNIIKDINNTMKVNIKIDYNNYLYFDNNEYELRQILVEEIYKNAEDEEKKTFNIYEYIKQFIKYPIFEKIKDVFTRANKSYNIWISGYAYKSVTNYLIVMIIRTDNTNYIKNFEINKNLLKNEYMYSKEIIKSIQNIDNKYIEYEILAFIDFIISKGVFLDNQDSMENLFYESIDSMVDYFNNSELNDLDIKSLKKDITRHLTQFIRRNQLGFNEEKNPLLIDIKANYPEYFKIASEAYSILQKNMNLDYSESEISYIAIYLYKNHKEKNNKEYKVMTVCGTGRGLAKLLQTRLENTFKNIRVVRNLSSFHFISSKDLNDIDFIVSTVSLPKVHKDVIVVSSFLGRRDLRAIREYIEYGDSIKSIPFRVENDIKLKNSSENLIFAKTYSNIFLKLYDTILNLPEEYSVHEDKVLGITIHLILAIPRIINEEVENEDFTNELIKIENENPRVSNVFNEFFIYVEKTLNVKIASQEKYAFYQYILSERR